jgi:hypothetical protein
MTEKKNKLGINGLIIFDGSCGACSEFIGRKSRFFKRYGFEVAPLQEDWISEITKLNEATLLESIHVLTPEGTIFRDVEFFIYLTEKIWWLKPINLLMKVPPCKRAFSQLYTYIAKKRRKISKLCGLESRAIYKSKH